MQAQGQGSSNQGTIGPSILSVQAQAQESSNQGTIGLSILSGQAQAQAQAQGSSNLGTIGLSILSGQAQQTGSHFLQRNIDLNVSSENNEPPLSQDLFRTETSLGYHQNPIFGGPSSPVMIHSGSLGFAVEENMNIEGLSTHGQTRLLCNRRASEIQPQLQNNIVNISSAASSSNNGTHSTRPVVAPSTQIGRVDNFQRFTRLRTTVSQQNPSTINVVSAMNSSNYNVQVQQQEQQAIGHQRQPTFSSPFGHFPMATSPQIPVMVNTPMYRPPPEQSIVLGVPNQMQAPPLPTQYLNGPHMSLFSPSTNFMIPPPPNMQANLNLINRNLNFLGREALMQPPSPFSSIRYPTNPTTLEQYTQRLQYDAGPYFPPHATVSPFARDMEISRRDGNPRPGQFRLGAIVDRQATQRSPLSRTIQSPLAAQRRRRQLVTQLRNYLRFLRRTGSYRLEDALLIGRSILNGNGIHLVEDTSEHGHQQLNVDNMSYEELLDMEEQIGDVSTGLSEETILANLRRRKYQPIIIQPPAEPEPCCICQEDYVNGEELGKLDCGHDFHFGCIKQWLVQKNLCPICKKTALAI